MAKRRQFHCEACGSACEIYKKGKKHRILVCPKCGVLATNPRATFNFKEAILKTSPATGIRKVPPELRSAIPFGDTIAAIVGEEPGTKSKSTPATARKSPGGCTKGERYVRMALGGKYNGC